MIGAMLDKVIGVFSPQAALRRTQHREALKRMYAGAEANRLTNSKKPQNLSADQELLGPFGADALRAWARNLVRDNAYAWGVVDTIVSSVVGCGITPQSQVETPDGDDIEDVNDIRDAVWNEWAEVCDVNGRFNFTEIQQLAQREMVEAGEVLIHVVRTKSKTYRGINRPVPLALELIEADRLAHDKDTYQFRSHLGSSENKVVRGIELDELGKAVAYWIYPEHPRSPYVSRVMPDRYDAADIIHLYRADRIGQSRGVSWFAPVMSWLRDLGLYVDNEMQTSAVAACFGVAITTNGRGGTGLMPSIDGEQADERGNQFEHLEPGMVVRLNSGESVDTINPGRPNASADTWIGLMLRGISVGTGLSYELVSRDYRGSSYSTSRTSQLEDRRRFRRWQSYLVTRLCQPVWDRFNEQAATAGVRGFASMTEILDDRRAATAVEWHVPVSEWVDPQNEQAASDAALNSFQSTYQDELGTRGKSWRRVFYQRAKEEKLKRELGLVSQEMAATDAQMSQAQQMAQQSAPQAGGGEMAEMSRLQWSRNRKAIEDVLAEFIAGTSSEAKTKVFLQSLGLTEATATMLIDDASDGTVDTDIDTLEGELAEPVKRAANFNEDDHPRGDDGKFGSGGGGGGSSGESKSEEADKPKPTKSNRVADRHKEKLAAIDAKHAEKRDQLTNDHAAKVKESESIRDSKLADIDKQIEELNVTQRDAEIGEAHDKAVEKLEESDLDDDEREVQMAALNAKYDADIDQLYTEENRLADLRSSVEDDHDERVDAMNDRLDERLDALDTKREEAIAAQIEKSTQQAIEKHQAETAKLASKHESEVEALEAKIEAMRQALEDKQSSEVDSLEEKQAAELEEIEE